MRFAAMNERSNGKMFELGVELQGSNLVQVLDRSVF